jgi:hypothetical protein
MKTSTTAPDHFTLKALLFVLAVVLALFFLTACDSPTEARGFTGLRGDRIGDDYVYYPSYEVYYMPTRREYVYYDGSRWVRTSRPTTQLWARDIARAPYVKMRFRDDPSHHHHEIARAYPRNWVPPEAVPGVPARTTNDDEREGRRR